jgi:seryl-tRNA synthetase
MLDVRLIAEEPDRVAAGLRYRRCGVDLDEVRRLWTDKKKLAAEMESLQNIRNTVSKEIPLLQKQKQDVSTKIAEMKEVGAKIDGLKASVAEKESALEQLLLHIPNLPAEGVPEGADETANKVVRTVGDPPRFPFTPLPHWEIGEKLGILDFKTASKISGARFALYKGLGAKLEFALIRFMLDLQEKNGYEIFLPPFLVNAASLTGTGQLPKFREDLFKCEGADLFLVPTAEVPLTNIHRDDILEEDSLPRKYTAYTPCFRSEAGSWGRDTRGLIRQHQFNKVELVKFSRPEESFEELEKMVKDASSVLDALGLAYRVVMLSQGDMGFSAAKCYDIEVWLPGQDSYREISSCSNCTDFQARRAAARFRRKETKKPELVHTLNGSGLAVGRTFLAILENFQTADGGVRIPEALRPYLGGLDEIRPPKK